MSDPVEQFLFVAGGRVSDPRGIDRDDADRAGHFRGTEKSVPALFQLIQIKL